jgi:hypothetical protein
MFSTSISGVDMIEIGHEFTMTFSLELEQSVKQVTATLDYDSDILEIVRNPVILSGLDVSVNESGDIIILSSEGLSGSITFMSVDFKVKESAMGEENANISLSNVSGILFASEESVSGSGSSKFIQLVQPASDNNYLSSLYTNSGPIGFDRNTFKYSLIVDYDVSRIRVVAIAEDDKAVVKEDAMYDLNVYQNTINIVVTAENGQKRIYTINVVRKDQFGHTVQKSANSELKSLAVEGYPFEFSPLIVEYRLTVGNIVDNVLVYAEASDPKSSVIIDNVPLLQLGENRIQITVIAENGQSRIYTVFITRSLEAPVIKLQELGDIVYLTTASVLPVMLEDSYVLSVEVLEKVRRAAKILDIQKLDDQGRLLFGWTIDGRSLTDLFSINTNITMNSIDKDRIAKLLNSSRFRTIQFSHRGEFPMGTIVRVYIGEFFPDMTSLNLYRFDIESDALKPVSSSLRVDSGYVEFEVALAGEYVVSDVEIVETQQLEVVLFVMLGVIVLVLVALIVVLINRKYGFSHHKLR